MLLSPVHDVGVYDVGGRADGSVCPSRPTCGPEGAVVHLLYTTRSGNSILDYKFL